MLCFCIVLLQWRVCIVPLTGNQSIKTWIDDVIRWRSLSLVSELVTHLTGFIEMWAILPENNHKPVKPSWLLSFSIPAVVPITVYGAAPYFVSRWHHHYSLSLMPLIETHRLTLKSILGCNFPLKSSISHTVSGCGSSQVRKGENNIQVKKKKKLPLRDSTVQKWNGIKSSS